MKERVFNGWQGPPKRPQTSLFLLSFIYVIAPDPYLTPFRAPAREQL